MKGSKVERLEGRNPEFLGDASFVEILGSINATKERAWILLIPDGEVDSENGNFILDKDGAEQAIEIFESRGVDIVVDYGHGSTQEYAPSSGLGPAAGWITKLRYEVDQGLYGLVKWTDRGLGYLRSHEFRYLSPVVILDRKTKRVLRLVSMGLVHGPAIKGGLPVAASRSTFVLDLTKECSMNGNVTTRQLNQEDVPAAADPGILLGQIATVLDIEMPADANIGTALQAILEGAKRLKGSGKPEGEGEKEGGEGGESAEVAASVRKELGLGAGASKAEVMLCLSRIKNQAAPDGEVAKLREQVNALQQREAGRAADELIINAVKANQLNPNNKAEMDAARELALESSERFEKVIGSRTPYVAPGRTAAPVESPPGGQQSEEVLITNAVKEVGGNYGQGLIALQKKLLQPYKDEGLTNAAANERCEKQYPKIFGVAAA